MLWPQTSVFLNSLEAAGGGQECLNMVENAPPARRWSARHTGAGTDS
jgi:hypothetical protein